MTAAGRLGDIVQARYEHGFDLAVVWLVAVWYLGGNLITILPSAAAYRSFGAEVAGWLVMAGIGAAGAVRLLRRRAGPAVSWALAGAALVVSALATAGLPGSSVLTAAWAWDATGWVGVVLLLRRPLVELGALIAVNTLCTLAVLLRGGVTDRLSLARFATVTYATSALQLTLALAALGLAATARRAASAAEAEAVVRRRRQVAEELHASRQERYRTVRRSLAPLLAGLASGELDPADRRVQHRCAVEACRLRRLFAESDDVPDPLLHELRACADLSDRRDVLVDLQVMGRLPALDLAVRRALLEAPLHALAGAEWQARVTVVGRSGEVAVSVLADGRPPMPIELPDPSRVGVTVTIQEGDDHRWVESRWRSG